MNWLKRISLIDVLITLIFLYVTISILTGGFGRTGAWVNRPIGSATLGDLFWAIFTSVALVNFFTRK